MKMTAPKKNCLIVLSSAIEGVSAQSFIQAFNLAKTVFNVQLTSPMAKAVEYVQADDNTRRWLADFRTKSFSQPISLESIDPSRYAALLIPNCPGAVSDLAQHKDLAQIIHRFVQEKKPICTIGLGVGALACAVDKDDTWIFKKYSMTAMSVYEVARSPIFGSMAIIPEDFIKDYGATYSSSEPGEVHIVVDRNLITGQNDQSTLIAVQNLILLSGQNRSEK